MDDADGATPSSMTTHMGLTILLPPLLGFVLGFVGSIPIAGPVSATIIKMSIENRLETQYLYIALGAGFMESCYAGSAFWGFGSLSAFIRAYEMVFRALGSIVLMVIGLSFMCSRTNQQAVASTENPEGTDLEMGPLIGGESSNRVVERETLRRRTSLMYGMGLTAVNPMLLATYTAALTTIYHYIKDHMIFDGPHALLFAIGVCSGVNAELHILICLLRRYKHRLRGKMLTYGIQALGGLLFLLGLSLVNSLFLQDAGLGSNGLQWNGRQLHPELIHNVSKTHHIVFQSLAPWRTSNAQVGAGQGRLVLLR